MRHIAAFFAILCVMLCGCDTYSDYIEPENRLFVTALGADLKDGNFSITAEVVTVWENSNMDKHGIACYNGIGKTPQSAIANLQTAISKRLTLSHCKLLVLGEALSDNGFDSVMAYCIDSGELSLNINIVAADNAESVIKQSDDEPVGEEINSMLEINRNLPSSKTDCTIIGTLNEISTSGGYFYLPKFGTDDYGTVFEGVACYKSFNRLCTVKPSQVQLFLLMNGKAGRGSVILGDSVLQITSFKTKSDINRTCHTVTVANEPQNKAQLEVWSRELTAAIRGISTAMPNSGNKPKEIVVKIKTKQWG